MAPGVAATSGSRVGGASDQALLTATRAGSDEAFLVLYDRYRDLAWRVARSVATNDLDAEDAVAEGFSRVYAALSDREIESFRSYLAATIRNAATDAHRRRDRPADDLEVLAPPLTSPSPEDWIVDLDEQAHVARAFAMLPERYRSALWLSEVEEFSTADIGHVLGTSANGAAALAKRARDRLREAYLGEHLGGALAPPCAETARGLGAHIRGSASRRASRKIDVHIEGCASCASRFDELKDLNRSLAGVIPATPASLLLGERILRDAQSTLPFRLAEGSAPVGEASSRLSEVVNGWAQAAVPLMSTTPGLTERVLQPVAAAVAGLIVAGSASIGGSTLERHDASSPVDRPVLTDEEWADDLDANPLTGSAGQLEEKGSGSADGGEGDHGAPGSASGSPVSHADGAGPPADPLAPPASGDQGASVEGVPDDVGNLVPPVESPAVPNEDAPEPVGSGTLDRGGSEAAQIAERFGREAEEQIADAGVPGAVGPSGPPQVTPALPLASPSAVLG